MAKERRYKEEEAKEIFGLAVHRDDPEPLALSDEDGLTLAELQDVGREIGVTPGRIAEAAHALESRRVGAARGKFWGVPISVDRTVDLQRDLTDREWDVLVGELRETFGARGRVTSHGGIREWTNGNLHAFLEPVESGHRLRLGTFKGTARPALRLGGVGLFLSLMLLTLFIGEQLPPAAFVASLLVLASGGVLGTTMIKLPRWAREREDQMNYIAGRVVALIADQPE